MGSVDNVACGTGNTIQSQSIKKRWCLTLNNYTEIEYNYIIECFKLDVSNKFIIGKEVGDSGTPHLQIYINLNKKERFSFFKNICNRFHNS